MGKKIAALLCGFVLSITTQVFANQLLTNGNFENGFPGGNWVQTGPAWQSVPAPQAFEGNAAAKNTIVDLGIDHFANMSQTVGLGANTPVWATVFAKSEIDPKAFARAILQVDFLNSANQVLGTKKSEIGGLSDWQQLYVNATSPAGTTQVRYNLIVFASAVEAVDPTGVAFGGAGYFDLAVLSTTPLTPPPAQITLKNGGFENGYVDWQLFPPGLTVDSTTFFQGVLSAKSQVGTLPGQDWFSGAYQDLVYQGGPVFASARFKTALTGTAIAGIKLEFYNASGAQLFPFSQKTIQGTNNWKQLIVNGNGSGVTPPAGTATIRVLVFTYNVQGGGNAGSANIDDVIFSYSPIPSNFDTTITNGGFENSLNGWSDLFGFPATIFPYPHSGSFAARKDIHFIAGQDYFSQTYWDVYFNASGSIFPTGTFVNATAWVLSVYSPVTKNKGGLVMEFINSSGNAIVSATKSHLDGGLSLYNYRYVSGTTPAGTQRVRISIVDFSREQDSAIFGGMLADDVVFSYNQLKKIPFPKFLVNGGFENGINGNGLFLGWVEANKPGEVETNLSFVFGGNFSARYEVDAQTNPLGINYFGSAHQDIKVSPNQKVTARVKAKILANQATPTSASISLTFFDQAGTQVGITTQSSIFGNTDWTTIQVVDKVAPAGTASARVTCSLFADKNNAVVGDRAWFDDASITITP